MLGQLLHGKKPGALFHRGNEKGFTLLETLIAMGILSTVAIVFISGMAVSSRAVMVSQQRVSADSLGKSQMEYVQNYVYDDVNSPPVYPIDGNLSVPAGYSLSVVAEHLDPAGEGTGDDFGLQKITVTVHHDGNSLLTIVGYKVKLED